MRLCLLLRALAILAIPSGFAFGQSLSALSKDPVTYLYYPDQNITAAAGWVPARTDSGEDVCLQFLRIYNHSTNEISPPVISLMFWKHIDNDQVVEGVITFKITRSGFSREVPAILLPDVPFLEGVDEITRQDGSRWQLRRSEMRWKDDPSLSRQYEGSAITKGELADMVRYKVRVHFVETLFEITNKGPFRVVEDDLLDDSRLIHKSKELRRNHDRDKDRALSRRALNPDRGPASQPSSPPPSTLSPSTPWSAPTPPENKEDQITHYIELVDGNVLRGKLVGKKDADPVVFVVIVGGIEQTMIYAAKDIAYIGESKN